MKSLSKLNCYREYVNFLICIYCDKINEISTRGMRTTKTFRFHHNKEINVTELTVGYVVLPVYIYYETHSVF